MAMLDLGINSEGIAYEVALEVLGKGLRPLISLRASELAKESPSGPLVAYLDARIRAIGDLQEDLRVEDRDTIELILSSDSASIFKA